MSVVSAGGQKGVNMDSLTNFGKREAGEVIRYVYACTNVTTPYIKHLLKT